MGAGGRARSLPSPTAGLAAAARAATPCGAPLASWPWPGASARRLACACSCVAPKPVGACCMPDIAYGGRGGERRRGGLYSIRARPSHVAAGVSLPRAAGDAVGGAGQALLGGPAIERPVGAPEGDLWQLVDGEEAYLVDLVQRLGLAADDRTQEQRHGDGAR